MQLIHTNVCKEHVFCMHVCWFVLYALMFQSAFTTFALKPKLKTHHWDSPSIAPSPIRPARLPPGALRVKIVVGEHEQQRHSSSGSLKFASSVQRHMFPLLTFTVLASCLLQAGMQNWLCLCPRLALYSASTSYTTSTYTYVWTDIHELCVPKGLNCVVEMLCD